jgi:hypothetical protein
MTRLFETLKRMTERAPVEGAATNVADLATTVAKPKRAKPPEPLQRPSDISIDEWEAMLRVPPCTLSAAELAINDKVFAEAVERAARPNRKLASDLPVGRWSLPSPRRFWK